uniref:Uncharacterized protein n=1 Tax=Magallana gigas TaxID=29159 RepID=A0A8W8HXB6_MAGGI
MVFHKESNAVCKRHFSCVKRIKSDWRSRLTSQMMNHLMTVSIKGPSLDDYNAERAIQLKYITGQSQILRKIMIMIKMEGLSC